MIPGSFWGCFAESRQDLPGRHAVAKLLPEDEFTETSMGTEH
jgi:hypothetical protein